MRKNNRKGFTIVELVIVIAVIAILAGVLIPTFAGIVNKAKKSAAEQEAANAYKEAYALAIADGKIEGETEDSAEAVTAGNYTFTFTGSIDKIESVEVEVLKDSAAAKDGYAVTVNPENGVVSVAEVGENSVTENGTWTE